MWISPLVVAELKRIVASSEITKEDDGKWPKKNIVGKQELEVRIGSDHIAFETAKIGSLVDIQDSDDPEGLRVFYYLVQDLKVRFWELICIPGINRTPLHTVPHFLPHLPALQDQAYIVPPCLTPQSSQPQDRKNTRGSSA